MQEKIEADFLPIGFICNGYSDINLNNVIEHVDEDSDDF